MNNLKQRIFSYLIAIGTVIVAPRIIATIYKGLRTQWHLVRQAEIVLFGGGGFGFTVIYPDAARRLYGPDRCCILFLGPSGRYNPIFAAMFPDISMIIVLFDDNFKLGKHYIHVNFFKILSQVVFPILKWVLERQKKTVVDWSTSMHRHLPYPEVANMPGGRMSLMPEMHRNNGFPRYYKLRQDRPAPPIRLPETHRQIVNDAIKRVSQRTGKEATKTCCLYTRSKGSASVTWDAFIRSGSPLEDYELAMIFLNERGYRILVIGDQKLSDALADRHDGMVVDAKRLGVDSRLFAAYAATECDFFLGEAGGGVDAPMGADRPCLLVNWLQYYAVVPKATHYYKHLRDNDGTILPPSELFGRFAWDLYYKDYDVCTNTPTEILSAVTDFVERLEKNAPLGLLPDSVGPTTPDMWFHFTDATISPPWLALFNKDHDGGYTLPTNVPL